MTRSGSTQHVTIPLHIIHNRPFVDFEITGVDGSSHSARFWVDTGGGALIITEALARKLGVSWQEIIENAEGRLAPFVPPPLTLDGLPINLEQAKSFVSFGSSTHFMPGVFADGMIGGHILAQYHVIFDYPHRQFTLAIPGALTPQGTAVSTPIHSQSGFPRIEVQIDGQTYGMLLDTGASHTMISRTLLDKLAAAHPEWPHALEPTGTANMGSSRVDKEARMLRLTELACGSFHLADISIISRRSGMFEEWMADMMTGPIIGALAGNVLKCFRVEIDYANQTTYLQQYVTPDTHDMDLVGLTLEAQIDGSYVVQGISTDVHDTREATRVQIGDKLLKVDGQNISGLSLTDAVDSLRGTPGQECVLRLERAGQVLEVRVPVACIL